MALDQTSEIERLEGIAERIRLLGGKLCLDFANTLEYRGTDRQVDLLVSYRALVLWSEHAGAIPPTEGQTFQPYAGTPIANSTFDQARTLRAVIYQIFAACAHDQAIPPKALDPFNTLLESALAHRRISIGPGGPAWTWQAPDDPPRLLWPIVYSAAELLTSSVLDRVHQCPGCGWLFLDESRNRNRIWCDMQICGNRSKARRHYQRQKPT